MASKLKTYDLPFDEDSSTRFIPWIIALTTFVSFILILGTLTSSSFIGKWSRTLGEQVTLQIPSLEPSSTSPEVTANQHTRVLQYLRMLPSVKSAELIDRDEVGKLLEPWLGSDIGGLDVPMPTLIAVKLRPEHPFDATTASNDLNKISHGISVIHHEQWHKDILRIASVLKIIGNLIVFLITIAAVGTLIFATYTGLVVHKDIIDTLRLMGARPTYIAKQFQQHTLRLALKGVLYSFLFLVFVGLFTKWFLGQFDAHLPLTFLSLTTIASVFAAVPIAVILAVTLTTRMTVGYVLNRDA